MIQRYGASMARAAGTALARRSVANSMREQTRMRARGGRELADVQAAERLFVFARRHRRARLGFHRSCQ